MHFFVLLLVTIPFVHAQDHTALRECSNFHRAIFHPWNSHGSFKNLGCSLVCKLGDQVLPVAVINEDFSCPQDDTGICHSGQCIGTVLEAEAECSQIFDLNFFTFTTNGTGYSRDFCSLICVVDGKIISINDRNEGMPCLNGIGVCHNGACETMMATSLDVIKAGTAPPTPYPLELRSIASYDFSKLESLNTTIVQGFFDSPYSTTYAIVCLVSSKSATRADCQQLSKTAIYGPTHNPVWNQDCTLKVSSANDLVLVGLWSRGPDIDNQIGYKIFTFKELMVTDSLYDEALHVAYGRELVYNTQECSFQLRIKYQFRP